MSQNHIDVHTHVVPPFWAKDLPEHGGDPSGWGAPEWSPERLLGFMAEEGIAVSMLSLTALERRRPDRHRAPRERLWSRARRPPS